MYRALTYAARTAVSLEDMWKRIWFQNRSTLPLELARIGIGAALLLNYGLATPYLYDFWGESAWMPQTIASHHNRDLWMQSILFYLKSPSQLLAWHVVFLFSCVAFMVGWRTSWVKWIVLVGEISYVHRNPALTYGVDRILCSLLFILCLAPIGRALSLDRVREVRAAKHIDLEAMPRPYTNIWAGACIRLIQIQMATLFFYSGISKIQGDVSDWRNGNAVWLVFSSEDYYNRLLLDLFASHYWLVPVATYAVLLLEIAFPFLIWQRSTRAYILAAAILLHIQIGVFMGLSYFAFVAIMGHMSFVRPEWLAGLGKVWKQKFADMEMIYDGECGFCKRSMAWFLAFDGLKQISIRNFRANPSPVVPSEHVEKASYLVLRGGRALPGFYAYRYVALRVPGLWWLVPLFYVPVFSRLFGSPIYNWIASNRSRLSSLKPAWSKWG
jgi:predicted DCC family thiol-disulfide oxidoreductase YuxK